MSVVCWPVKVSASGFSLVQRSPTDCGVSECGREGSTMRRTWPTRGCCVMEGGVEVQKIVYKFRCDTPSLGP